MVSALVPLRPVVAAGTATVVLDGEVDLACADALRTTLEQQRRAGRRHVRVDTSAVTFIDATILGVLLDAHLEFLACGATLVLSDIAPRVERLLRITGLDSVFFIAAPSQPGRTHTAHRSHPRRPHTKRPAIPV